MTGGFLPGRSAAICEVNSLIARLGGKRISVLIQGETGTGKEVVARTLHSLESRGEFIPIDCGVITDTLAESELFGHSRGAFTGAYQAKRGLVQQAHGGTAFFDEIGDLPLNLQGKLLRVLQERDYRPVGALTRVKVDIRVISATHRDLLHEIQQGRFRRDLYHRLNVVSVVMPPLRERREDIPLLVEHFLMQFGETRRVEANAMQAILSYDWPGNIRELQNCVEHMIALSSGGSLQLDDLPMNVVGSGRPARNFAAAGISLATNPEPRTLREIERNAILDALNQTNGVLMLAGNRQNHTLPQDERISMRRSRYTCRGGEHTGRHT
jgi:DNA-binding NtrC family response regulator